MTPLRQGHLDECNACDQFDYTTVDLKVTGSTTVKEGHPRTRFPHLPSLFFLTAFKPGNMFVVIQSKRRVRVCWTNLFNLRCFLKS
jgi:hypothetical protein